MADPRDHEIAKRQRQAFTDAAAGIYYPRPPRPAKRKDDDDDAEEETQMERQRRQARERRLVEEARALPSSAAAAGVTPAAPADSSDSPDVLRARASHAAWEAQMKPKKIGSSPMAQRVAECRSIDRRCDVPGCTVQTDGMSSLCNRHLIRRRQYGSPKTTRRLKHSDYAFYLGLAVKHLKKTPPPADVIESMASFLIPPGLITGSREPGKKARVLLRREMTRWQDTRYRNKYTDHGGYTRKADYSPRGYLAVLVAIASYIEERQGVGFPGDAEGIETAFALCRLHRRPGRPGASAARAKRYPPGHVKLIKYSQKAAGSVLRAIAKRLHEYPKIGLYALQTAKALVAQQVALRAESNAKLAKATPRTPTREDYLIWKAHEDAKRLAERRAAFDKETPPPDPGPRPPREQHLTVEYTAKVAKWCEADSKYRDYNRRLLEFHSNIQKETI